MDLYLIKKEGTTLFYRDRRHRWDRRINAQFFVRPIAEAYLTWLTYSGEHVQLERIHITHAEVKTVARQRARAALKQLNIQQRRALNSMLRTAWDYLNRRY